jgi:hypothetical protein
LSVQAGLPTLAFSIDRVLWTTVHG